MTRMFRVCPAISTIAATVALFVALVCCVAATVKLITGAKTRNARSPDYPAQLR